MTGAILNHVISSFLSGKGFSYFNSLLPLHPLQKKNMIAYMGLVKRLYCIWYQEMFLTRKLHKLIEQIKWCQWWTQQNNYGEQLHSLGKELGKLLQLSILTMQELPRQQLTLHSPSEVYQFKVLSDPVIKYQTQTTTTVKVPYLWIFWQILQFYI